MGLVDECPNCKADLRDLVNLVDGQQKYYRTIGRYDWKLDRTVGWQCPDCGYYWARQGETRTEETTSDGTKS